MPEKLLWARNVGMETLGSTGSCDSMESISSNHSAFSGDYDHLSKEERECLMFLEETIDSLDNEVDSGLSNDESETAENIPSRPSSEPARIPPSSGDDKAPIKSTVIHTTEERREDNAYEEVNKMPPKQGYHSFPRIIQCSKDEIPKPLSESKLLDSMDKAKFVCGKPKSLTAINQEGVKLTSTTDLILLPPPEPFRDPQFVDKRRSVTDPTDVRETRLEKLLPKLSTYALYKEAPPTVGHYPDKVPPAVKFPRPLSPNPVATRSQEVVITLADKHGDFKQGPPTAPKPRKLPPHIIIKPSTGGGVISNLDPQQRPRAFSAHERNTDKSSDSSNTKLPHSKEQESARREALQKLGLLQEKGNKEEHNSNKPSVTPKTEQISVSHEGMEHGQKDAYRKSVNITQQDRPNVLGTSPVQPSVLALHKGVESVINEGFSRKRLSMKSNSLERSDELGGVLAQDEGSPRSVKANAVGRGTLCVVSRPQEKENEMAFPTPKEAEPQTNKSPKLNPKSTALKNQVNMKSSHQEKPDEPIDTPVLAHKDAQAETDTTVKYSKVGLGGNSTILKTNTLEKGIMSQEGHPISETASNLPNADKPLENRTKIGSSDNINMISTSPGKTFSFPRPKDVSIPSTSPEVALRGRKSQAANDKSKRHSSHMEPSGEQYLRLPQSSVAGLRQINIKSNTLERSGVGLSSSMSSFEDQNRKGSGSFFKKSIFSGNFLRNSRPRPASLGTGKDFAGMEPSTSEAEITESRESIIFRKSHPVAPVTSVKITPKGSTDEHRREALKKLGILKE